MNRRREQQPGIRREAGLSYVEVMAAMLIIVVSIVPMIDTLQFATLGTAQHEVSAIQHYRVLGRMEDLLAENFSVLATEAIAVGDPTTLTSFSDPGGTVNRRLVFLSLYDGDDADADGDPFTGTDPGLVWLRVEIEGTQFAMTSLKTW